MPLPKVFAKKPITEVEGVDGVEPPATISKVSVLLCSVRSDALVVRPGAPSSVLAPSSKARSP